MRFLPVFAILMIAGLAAGSASAFTAPSFDCRQAQRPDEYAICDDPSLARLDRIFDENYSRARVISGRRAADIAKAFNRQRRDCGANRICIRQVQIDANLAMLDLGGTVPIPRDLIPVIPSAVPTPVTASVGAVAAAAAGPGAQSQTTQVIVNAASSAETDKLKRQVAILEEAVRKQQEAAKEPPTALPAPEDGIDVKTDDELVGLVASFDKAAETRSLYPTPIRPNDRDLGVTARKASERFPHVPFYIPGTRESGRFWVEPRVSETGVLFYDMTFVDPGAGVDRRRAVIDLTGEHLERMKIAVGKLAEWSEISHRNGIRRAYRKRVDCFPEAECPIGEEKRDGRASTEIVFIVNEDGSTAGRIQRNKGRFEEGYNLSINSSVLLRAYLRYVQSRGEREFIAGTRTTDDLNRLFK
jgi:uncharacterized protein